MGDKMGGVTNGKVLAFGGLEIWRRRLGSFGRYYGGTGGDVFDQRRLPADKWPGKSLA